MGHAHVNDPRARCARHILDGKVNLVDPAIAEAVAIGAQREARCARDGKIAGHLLVACNRCDGPPGINVDRVVAGVRGVADEISKCRRLQLVAGWSEIDRRTNSERRWSVGRGIAMVNEEYRLSRGVRVSRIASTKATRRRIRLGIPWTGFTSTWSRRHSA